MLRIIRKKKFDKDIKRLKRRGKNLKTLEKILEHLVYQNPLPATYKDHELKGEFVGCRECHIEPDWLLIYYIDNDKIIVVRTGTHSDLFR